MKKMKAVVLLCKVISLVGLLGLLMACPKTDDPGTGPDQPDGGGGTTWTVTFDLDGGTLTGKTSPWSITVNKGGTIGTQFPTGEPEKTGKTFAGWFLAGGADLTKEYTAATLIDKDITLKAKWVDEDVNVYTVEFDANGGTINGQAKYTIRVIEGNTIGASMPPTPIYAGKDFLGWYDEDDTEFAGPVYTANDPEIEGDVTLKAKWADKVAGGWTVTFNPDNGDTPTSVSAANGQPLGDRFQAAPAKPDYKFLGWYLGEIKYTAETPNITADITLTAKWVSADASIRDAGIAADAVDVTKTAGFYIGGVPATSNGTPGKGTGTPEPVSNGVIKTNKVTGTTGSSIVVITKKEVSKVEIAYAASDTTSAGSYTQLTKDNGTETPAHLTDLRWTGTVTQAYPAATAVQAVYVRITALDAETVQVYRYSWTRTIEDRGILTSFTIGGVPLTASAAGTFAEGGNVRGWPNNTVSPGFAYSTITIPQLMVEAGDTVSVSVNVTNTGHGGKVKFTRLPATIPYPFLEGTVYHYENTTVDPIVKDSTESYTATVAGVTNGDYILVRYWGTNAGTGTEGEGYFAAACVKVTIENSAPKPVITTDLSETPKTYTQNTTPVEALSVTVTPPAEGVTHTYKWYKSSGGSGAVAELIAGETGPSYTPPVTTVGTVYYYVTVTATYAGAAETITESKWAEIRVVAPSNNANIRAPSVNATGAAAYNTTYGLYIGGVPAVSNYTTATSSDWNNFTGTSGGIIAGTSEVTYKKDSPVVVITEDFASKVEFAQIWGSTGTAALNVNPTAAGASGWQSLIPSSSGVPKTWEGKMAGNDDGSSRWSTAGLNMYACYVRITAGDGTTMKTYRYRVTVGNLVANTNGYTSLSALTIGGVTVVNSTANKDQKPTPSGWWYKQVAPNLTESSVTISSGTSVVIAGTWVFGSSGKTVEYAVIPASAMPLKEGDTISFTALTAGTTSGNLYDYSATVPSIADGNYILLRTQYISNNYPITGFYLIKVNVSP